MPNLLVLEDRRNDPWGKVSARIIWEGGGQSEVWVGESGRGEFSGSGLIQYIKVAGEEIPVTPRKVDGRTTIIAVSKYAH